MLPKLGTYWAPPEYASPKSGKYQHAKHAVICIHFWFWISVLFKYAVRNSPALPLALSRCTLTLSLVLIELRASKAALQWRREWANIWIAKTHHLPRGGNSRQLFRVKDTPPTPRKLTLCMQHKKSQHIHSVSTLLTNLPYPHLCNGIWHILEGIAGGGETLIWGENHKMFKLVLYLTEIHHTNPGSQTTWHGFDYRLKCN